MADVENVKQVGSDADLRQERNLDAIERVARPARIGASVLVAVGALVFVGWLWRAVRTQVDPFTYSGLGFAFGDGAGAPSPSLAERLDLFAMSLEPLLYSVLAVALGLFLRAAADHLVARSGGSLPRSRPRQEPEWPTS